MVIIWGRLSWMVEQERLIFDIILTAQDLEKYRKT